MGLYLVYVITFAVSAVAAGAVLAYWVANRKRIAAETIGRAEEQALRIIRYAERDAERVSREKAQQLSDAEQKLRRQESSLQDKLSTAERREKELQAQSSAIA